MSKLFRENVEIISSASGQSGLKLVNLPAGTPQTAFNGILGLDASGNVIKIDATKIATVTVGPVAPSAPVSGQQWLDTSVSPSELKIYNGTSWELAGDEVQHYANFAAFPATGDEDVLYVDDAADIVYVWDSTTSAYVNASGTGAGLFSITDGVTTQSIGVGNTITFQENANIGSVLKFEVAATDVVEIQANTVSATIGQVMKFNGTNVVRGNADNIYTADGVFTSLTRTARFGAITTGQVGILAIEDQADQYGMQMFVDPVLTLYPTVSVGVANGIRFNEDGIYADTFVGSTGGQGELVLSATDRVILRSLTNNYTLLTAPTTATTQTQSLVRDASTGRLYLKDLTTLSSARYANTWTPTANVETVHTHALSAGEDVQIQVRDSVTKEIVDVEIRIISATTFGVTSTTADPLRVIAL